MKALFFTVLIASLGANLVIGSLVVSQRAGKSVGFSKAPGSHSTAMGSLAGSPGKVGNPTGKNETAAEADPTAERRAAFRSLRERLIREGYPVRVAEAVVMEVASEMLGVYEFEAELRAETKNAKLENRMISRELIKKGSTLNARVFDDLRGILDMVQRNDEYERQNLAVRYGDLPQETIEQVRELENTHRSLSDQWFSEKLVGLLTPAQTDEFVKYNTLLARNVQYIISSIDVDEATYSALLNAAIEREGSATPNLPVMELAKRNRLPASAETYRRILGDEQFLRVIGRFDKEAASADAVYQMAGLGPQLRADLFMEAYTAGHETEGIKSREEIAERAARLYQSLTQKAGLTPEQIEGFDRMLGGSLKQGRLQGGSFGYPSGR